MTIQRKFIKKASVLSFLLSLVISGCSGGESPSAPTLPPRVLFSAPSDSNPVNQGKIFTRTVEVQGMQKAFSAAFDVIYDPSVIEYVKADEGPFLNRSNALNTSFFQSALQDGVKGRIVIGLTLLGQVDGVSEGGTLLTLSFRALNPGVTTLAFADPKSVKNNLNQSMSIDSWGNTTITVQ